jgi:hypothetical protein
MYFTQVTIALLCAVPVAVHWYLTKKQISSPFPLPPGPPGLPIVGNVRGIDVAAPWRTYARWGKQYGERRLDQPQVSLLLEPTSHRFEYRAVGDLVYSRLFQQDIIIINSEKIAKELLEERSNNYANRPHLVTSAL